jgi:hypothetical protein
MFRFFRWLLGRETTEQATASTDKSVSGINKGDYHSGPAGYSPNTPYSETQYGSSFDQEADWADGDQ